MVVVVSGGGFWPTCCGPSDHDHCWFLWHHSAPEPLMHLAQDTLTIFIDFIIWWCLVEIKYGFIFNSSYFLNSVMCVIFKLQHSYIWKIRKLNVRWPYITSLITMKIIFSAEVEYFVLDFILDAVRNEWIETLMSYKQERFFS